MRAVSWALAARRSRCERQARVAKPVSACATASSTALGRAPAAFRRVPRRSRAWQPRPPAVQPAHAAPTPPPPQQLRAGPRRRRPRRLRRARRVPTQSRRRCRLSGPPAAPPRAPPAEQAPRAPSAARRRPWTPRCAAPPTPAPPGGPPGAPGACAPRRRRRTPAPRGGRVKHASRRRVDARRQRTWRCAASAAERDALSSSHSSPCLLERQREH